MVDDIVGVGLDVGCLIDLGELFELGGVGEVVADGVDGDAQAFDDGGDAVQVVAFVLFAVAEDEEHHLGVGDLLFFVQDHFGGDKDGVVGRGAAAGCEGLDLTREVGALFGVEALDGEVDRDVVGVAHEADVVVLADVAGGADQGFLEGLERAPFHAAGGVGDKDRDDGLASVLILFPDLLGGQVAGAVEAGVLALVFVAAVEALVGGQLLALFGEAVLGKELRGLPLLRAHIVKGVDGVVVADAGGDVDIALELGLVDVGLLLHDHGIDDALGRLVAQDPGRVGDRRGLLLVVQELAAGCVGEGV